MSDVARNGGEHTCGKTDRRREQNKGQVAGLRELQRGRLRASEVAPRMERVVEKLVAKWSVNAASVLVLSARPLVVRCAL